MARIEGVRIQNYRALRDVSLGRLWNRRSVAPLTPLTAVIGKNGAGKSTLFDAFGFLADALKSGIEAACDLRGRGGFERLRTQGQNGPIAFEVCYREDPKDRPITYEVAFDVEPTGRPFVLRERLRRRRKNQTRGWPFSFLMLEKGKGVAWRGDFAGRQIDEHAGFLDATRLWQLLSVDGAAEETKETEFVDLDDVNRLGIALLGSLKQHPRISAFRRFIEGWYLSYFTPDAARSLRLAGPHQHLDRYGNNLGNVVQFLEREHPERFRVILSRIAERMPGITTIDTERTSDDRLLLRFNDDRFRDPFFAQQMSDGTLKVFAYLLLLEHPNPPPFLGIEGPENGLYHKLLELLAEEFRSHSEKRKGGVQIFLTTHQPYLVDALNAEEVWILSKGPDGHSVASRASADPVVQNMVAEGLPLGGLWYSDYLDAA